MITTAGTTTVTRHHEKLSCQPGSELRERTCDIFQTPILLTLLPIASFFLCEEDGLWTFSVDWNWDRTLCND
jgi:hypothetical protein